MTRMEELLTALINGETVSFEPQSRIEKYLKNCCDKCGCDGLPPPSSRAEILLAQLAEMLKDGGGSGGTSGATAYTVSSVDELPSDAVDGSMAIVGVEVEDWIPKIWNTTVGMGSYVWEHKGKLYASTETTHLVYNDETDTWETKVWNGLAYLHAAHIWKHNGKAYLSFTNAETDEYEHYVLNDETDTWETKVWNGFTNFNGSHIAIIEGKAYCSTGYPLYVLDDETDTWSTITWGGMSSPPFKMSDVWEHNGTYFYSYASTQKVLNGDTWENKTWSMTTEEGKNPDGSEIWTYNGKSHWLYSYNDGTFHYFLYTYDETIGDFVKEEVNWSSAPSMGSYVWEHNGKLYYAQCGNDYIFGTTIKQTLYTHENGEWVYKCEVV